MSQIVLRMGSKGQLSVPAEVLRRWGLRGEAVLLAEAATDGALILRPAGVYPLEIYDAERLAEFEAEDRMEAAERRAVGRALGRKRAGAAVPRR